jgi:hypothetical protein|tara:strand:- start:9661 stop:10089 length:429 start_codon:yes stop_codon:yes gene_type:complete
MADYVLPATYGLMTAGLVTSAFGQAQAGKAAEKAAKFNAEMSRRETSMAIEAQIRRSRLQRSTNITQVAKSGVRLSGSPLVEIAESQFQNIRQIGMIRDAGEIEAEIYKMRGDTARAASRMGIASSVLSGAGQLGSFAVKNA